MRVCVIPTNQPVYLHDLEGDTLKGLQSLVDGYIEPCAPAQLREVGIELLANEEGLLRGLAPNVNLFPFFFVGQLVAVGIGEEDFVSLTPVQEKKLLHWLYTLG